MLFLNVWYLQLIERVWSVLIVYYLMHWLVVNEVFNELLILVLCLMCVYPCFCVCIIDCMCFCLCMFVCLCVGVCLCVCVLVCVRICVHAHIMHLSHIIAFLKDSFLIIYIFDQKGSSTIASTRKPCIDVNRKLRTEWLH